jgi:uncharacterized protein
MPQSRKSKRNTYCGVSSDPPSCIVLLAHGASGWSPRLDRFSRLLQQASPSASNGISVVPLVYPYAADARRRPPPKAETLVAYHLEKVQGIASSNPACRIVLAGHSMGGRVGVMVAALPDLPRQVCGVICFSYPLVGINRSLRLAPLETARVPLFLIQGSRDPFFPPSASALVPSSATVFVVDGGDHSLCLASKKLHTSFSSSQDTSDDTLISPFLAAVMLQLQPQVSSQVVKRSRG